MASVNDKWDEKEPEKGHKLVDTLVAECTSLTTHRVGNDEYMSEGSWKAQRTATYPSKVETHCPKPGRRARTSRNTYSKSPAAPGTTQALKGAAPISPTNTLSGGTYESRIELL